MNMHTFFQIYYTRHLTNINAENLHKITIQTEREYATVKLLKYLLTLKKINLFKLNI